MDYVNTAERHGCTPLHAAVHICNKDSVDIVRALVDAGATRELLNEDGHRPLDLIKYTKKTKSFYDDVASMLND